MKIICVLLGTIIGAGFISGAEIGLFFNSAGIFGIVGILISSILLGLIINIVLEDNNKEYIELIENNIDNKYISFCVKGIVNLFLIVSYFIMIAGLTSFIHEEIEINYLLSSIISVSTIFIIVKGNIKRIEKFNEIFVPFLILLIIGLCFIITDTTFDNIKNNIENINIYDYSFLILGITYASYNAISILPVAYKLKENVNLKKNERRMISIFFSVITFICALIIYLLVEGNKTHMKSEIPMLDIIKGNNIFIIIFVKITIIISIISTAVSVQYAAASNITHNKKSFIIFLMLMNLMAIGVSKYGFQTLIKIFYPVFGVIGILNFIILMKNYAKYSKINTKYCKIRQ